MPPINHCTPITVLGDGRERSVFIGERPALTGLSPFIEGALPPRTIFHDAVKESSPSDSQIFNTVFSKNLQDFLAGNNLKIAQTIAHCRAVRLNRSVQRGEAPHPLQPQARRAFGKSTKPRIHKSSGFRVSGSNPKPQTGGEAPQMGTLLTRKRSPLGPYHELMPRVPGGT